ncbi:related to cap binding protein 80 (Cbp80) [Cephalotrichum gorgonifer]|uniref:Related to cap binding protein 80 (Cbp80) n=1 Tax=Cephalotrichum gorgonifer TaxID=2041049 RepID=A0AAE8MU57_9PEZI|nr:related to cap binding protein 80 (Cbp80) [Cephalotrichum gorgonifer]
MADYDRRQSGGGYGHYNGRKRRYRDDDDYNDRRGGQRRRLESAPLPVRIRKQLLTLAESPLRRWTEEVQSIARLIAENYDNEELRNIFVDLTLQIAVEQPLKTPFVAAVVLFANTLKPDIVGDILTKVTAETESRVKTGDWRGVKLCLKLLACLQSCLTGDGIFPVLEELFSRAVDLQTASSDDTIGTELVKIILLTLPYIMAASEPSQWQQKAADIMDKTDIIAGEPHAMQALIDPYHTKNHDGSPSISTSVIGLLQTQLQTEAANGWKLACLPRPWNMPFEDVEARESLENASKHDLPAITIPATVIAGPRPLFPEVYVSVYGSQDAQSVPPPTDVAASLIRDGLQDTINILDFNRNVTARYLIDIDCYFADGTFIKRATPFDRLKDIESGKTTWKPEDVAVDAVFSQILQLPAPEHKLVYYHSVLTEACKIAPAAIAPSLGRAIRYIYRNTVTMDVEVSYRFIDWFSHHLSNFGFTWKWTEWEDDVSLPDVHPWKAFILGALDKEIRLSFAQRIKGTLPPAYQKLIGPEKEQDVPDFKFNDPDTPFFAEGQEIAGLLKRKSPDEDFQPIIERIHSAALDQGLDPLVSSTDVFMTAVCWVGSKSLSHVLACIDRTKGRLLDVGAASEGARAQIITSVMEYWSAQPGVAISIIEKLLNYSILTPLSVIHWALVGTSHAGGTKTGDVLAKWHIFELVFKTVTKVTVRVRQVSEGETPSDAHTQEVKAMKELFAALDDALQGWSTGANGTLADAEEQEFVQGWAERWLRVFRRRAAIEEAFAAEAEKAAEVKVIE